jgi:hypothetical protein
MRTVSMQGEQLLEALRQHYTLAESDTQHPGGEDRRDCTRYDVQSEEASVLVALRDESMQPARILTVSADGLRLVMDEPPQPGEVVRLLFDLGDTQIQLNAEVRHVCNDQADPFVGLRFTDALVGPPAPLPPGDACDDN